MDEKPEALLLAECLDEPQYLTHRQAARAAAELRRLHEAHEWQYKMAGDRLRRVEKLQAVNDELLEALRSAAIAIEVLGGSSERYRAAIAKTEEK